MRDIQSYIPLCLKEFPRAKPEGTPEGKGLYLTVYPKSSHNTDIISFNNRKANVLLRKKKQEKNMVFYLLMVGRGFGEGEGGKL